MNTQSPSPSLAPVLFPILLAVGVNRDLNDGDADDSASTSSKLTTFSQGNSAKATAVNADHIPLSLADWGNRAATTVSPAQSRSAARELVQYFLDFGQRAGLQPDSRPLQILRAALDEINAINPAEANRQSRRAAHTRENPPSYTLRLREYVFNEVPLFNVWDAMALVYSISIEDIRVDKEAELYLYQLRLIMRAAYETKWWARDFLPTTVQAAWTKSSQDERFIVGFAFTCIGGKDGKLRDNQVAARKAYNNKLYSLVTKSDKELRALGCGNNKPGTCPEFSTWATICQEPGKFKSLCLSLLKEVTMQCCGAML